jgi:puromycin-sensitive aminopeptidase
VISNTPVKSENSKNQTNNILFEPTPKLPCYLLSFVIGDYKIDASDYHEEILIQILVPSSRSSPYPSDLILDSVLKSILFLENYFDSKISETGIKKLDIVVVPKFCLGGMENHGCIFLNETDCLHLNDKNRELFIELISHEGFFF